MTKYAKKKRLLEKVSPPNTQSAIKMMDDGWEFTLRKWGKRQLFPVYTDYCLSRTQENGYIIKKVLGIPIVKNLLRLGYKPTKIIEMKVQE